MIINNELPLSLWNCLMRKANRCEQRRGLHSREYAMTVRDLTGRGPSCSLAAIGCQMKVQHERYLLNKGNLRVSEVCCPSVAIDTFANIALLQSYDLARQLTHVQQCLIAQQQNPCQLGAHFAASMVAAKAQSR